MFQENINDYNLTEYKSCLIASHKKNKSEKNVANKTMVFPTNKSSQDSIFLGYNASETNGIKPHNFMDAKELIDQLTKSNPRTFSNDNLPIHRIWNNEFYADVMNMLYIEKNNPQNRLYLGEMLDTGFGYTFKFDPVEKNIPLHDDIDSCIEILLPYFSEIDPIRTAQKFNIELGSVLGKKDFELAIQPGSSLDNRWNHGQLPIINIIGTLYAFDLDNKKFSRIDDPFAKGIGFNELSKYYFTIQEEFAFPYDPIKKEVPEFNMDNLTELPKNIKMVSLPRYFEIDPVAWDLSAGFTPGKFGDDGNVVLYREAQILSWQQTNIPEIIENNLKSKNTNEFHNHLNQYPNDNSHEIER